MALAGCSMKLGPEENLDVKDFQRPSMLTTNKGLEAGALGGWSRRRRRISALPPTTGSNWFSQQ
jgi:hypothetical protein